MSIETAKTIESRKISYSWDSAMEDAGLDAYRFDCFVWKDGKPLVDEHQSFRTYQEFAEAMGQVLPLLRDIEPTRQKQALKVTAST